MTNGNDAAFSRGGFAMTAEDYDLGAEGMTKREYFAAMALQGLCAKPDFDSADAPSEAVLVAEALIEELNKFGQSDLAETEQEKN